MSRLRGVDAVVVAAGLLACNVTSEDERGSIGDKLPPIAYCEALGYVMVDAQCQFPDGTACEQWSFYRGSCGQEHSWCNLHGGQVTNETKDMGTWTAEIAVCTIDGQRCLEDPLYRTGVCESPDGDGGI